MSHPGCIRGGRFGFVLQQVFLWGLLVTLTSWSVRATAETHPTKMVLTSSAFSPGGAIPRRYTCQGQDKSPPLQWKGVPSVARSLALIVDDPDAPDPKAPKMVWVHWVAFNIEPSTSGLAEDTGSQLAAQKKSGLNDWKRTGYGGPCPPIGRHRYYFRLYALSAVLPASSPLTKAELLKAMEGKVLATAELVGTYEKAR